MNQAVLKITDFEHPLEENYQSIDNEDIDLNKLFQQSKEENLPQKWLVRSADPKQSFKKWTKKIKRIDAGGGLVRNGKGELLFIYRLGKWDLPKGKVDAGEKVGTTAVREVEEECGVHVDYRGPKLAITYHLYKMKGDLVLKRTDWYEMGVNKSPKLTPQKNEDITKAVWLAPDKLGKIEANTYPLVRELLELIAQRWGSER